MSDLFLFMSGLLSRLVFMCILLFCVVGDATAAENKHNRAIHVLTYIASAESDAKMCEEQSVGNVSVFNRWLNSKIKDYDFSMHELDEEIAMAGLVGGAATSAKAQMLEHIRERVESELRVTRLRHKQAICKNFPARLDYYSKLLNGL